MDKIGLFMMMGLLMRYSDCCCPGFLLSILEVRTLEVEGLPGIFTHQSLGHVMSTCCYIAICCGGLVIPG